MNRVIQCSQKKEDQTNIPNKGSSPYQEMEEIKINSHGIYKLLQSQNPYKATGPDDIPAHILRGAARQLAPILTHIYQYSLRNQGISLVMARVRGNTSFIHLHTILERFLSRRRQRRSQHPQG